MGASQRCLEEFPSVFFIVAAVAVIAAIAAAAATLLLRWNVYKKVIGNFNNRIP